jgi:DNA repair protein RadA/Sms
MAEFRESRTSSKGTKKSARKPQYLSEISNKETKKTSTGIDELDIVLGGGILPGQVILLAGDPGIGKSTLLLELASKVKSVLYVSGEESVSQIKIRADRMKINSKEMAVLSETNIDTVLATAEEVGSNANIGAVFIDSVQTMYTEDLTSVPGAVGQVREATFRLVDFAKKNNVPVIIVGHVTKVGTVAGPATLAHMVDTVLWFEGDKVNDVRILRSVKNRFGSTDEVGVFKMVENGLKSADDTATLFLEEQSGKPVAGTVISCAMEGKRPFLVEVQALVVPTKLAFPRRVVHGIDSKKAELIIAVLTRHCNIQLGERDVFINVVGGIKLKDPGIDLAVAIAIASSYKNKPVSKNTLAVGEVGLLGEVRSPSYEGQRVDRAKKQGYRNIISSIKHKTVSSSLSASIK